MLVGSINFSSQRRVRINGKLAYPFTRLSGTAEERVDRIFVPIKTPRKVSQWAQITLAHNNRCLGCLCGYIGPTADHSSELKAYMLDRGFRSRGYHDEHLRDDPFPRTTTVENGFSIDDEATLDQDDVLTLERNPHGVLLGIHITDVACRVAPGSATWERIMGYQSTIYTHFGNHTMFSPETTYGHLSMRPGESRPCLTLWVEWRDDTASSRMWFEHTTVTNRRAWSYNEFDTSQEASALRDMLLLVSKQASSRKIVEHLMLIYNGQAAQAMRECPSPMFRCQPIPNQAAVYSTEAIPHAALGMLYSHATSPVRRFADVFVQHCIHSVMSHSSCPCASASQLESMNTTSAAVRAVHRVDQILALVYKHKVTPLCVKVDVCDGDSEREGVVRFELCVSEGTVVRYTFGLSDPMMELVQSESKGSYSAQVWGIHDKHGKGRLRVVLESL